MRGVSRQSLTLARERLETELGARGIDPSVIGQELLSVAEVFGTRAALRRALSDPTAQTDAKVQLVHHLLDAHVNARVVDLLGFLVAQRWATPGDFVDAVEA